MLHIKLAQLFMRKVPGLTPNTYLVCGLINTETPIQAESVYTLLGTPAGLCIVGQEDRTSEARGNGLDGIMGSPFWKLR